MLPLGRRVCEQPLRLVRTALLTLGVASFTLLAAGVAAPARGVPLLVDFQGLDHGEILDGSMSLGPDGVIQSITTNNKGVGPDLAIIFDTTQRNTADEDLEGPNGFGGGSWAGGNLAPDTHLGNILIISENYEDADNDGRIDDPDDEGDKPAGTIHIIFNQVFTDMGFDLVDIEDNFAETMGSVEFLYDGVSVGEVEFAELASLQDDIHFGDNHANRVDTMDGLQVDAFKEVIIKFGGSGGITNLVLTPIPEPSTALLLSMGLVGLAISRERQKRAEAKDRIYENIRRELAASFRKANA